MPAPVTHYIFTKRVLKSLTNYKIDVPHQDMVAIGAQGPDIFFFHRVFPWQVGESLSFIGSALHRSSPAKLFDHFRDVLLKERKHSAESFELMLCYIYGFICHYTLDRAAHPYIRWAEDALQTSQPSYGKTSNDYHFKIESALDTIMLRQESGRFVSSFNLKTIFPANDKKNFLTVGVLYQPILYKMFNADYSVHHISLAPADMRFSLGLMTDKNSFKRGTLGFAERVFHLGPKATALLRPNNTDDWDYANEDKCTWFNPFNRIFVSSDSFYDIYLFAIKEALDMISAFHTALENGTSMMKITQDRGFNSDLPGVYDSSPTV